MDILNYFRTSINELRISINELWISLNKLWISNNREQIVKRQPIERNLSVLKLTNCHKMISQSILSFFLDFPYNLHVSILQRNFCFFMGKV